MQEHLSAVSYVTDKHTVQKIVAPLSSEYMINTDKKEKLKLKNKNRNKIRKFKKRMIIKANEELARSVREREELNKADDYSTERAVWAEKFLTMRNLQHTLVYFGVVCKLIKNTTANLVVIDLNNNRDEVSIQSRKKTKNDNKIKNNNNISKPKEKKPLTYESAMKKAAKQFNEKQKGRNTDLLRTIERTMKYNFDFPQALLDRRDVLQAQADDLERFKLVKFNKNNVRFKKPRSRNLDDLDPQGLLDSLKNFRDRVLNKCKSIKDDSQNRSAFTADFPGNQARDYFSQDREFETDTEKFQFVELAWNLWSSVPKLDPLFKMDMSNPHLAEVITFCEKLLTYTDNPLVKNILSLIGLMSSTNLLNSVVISTLTFNKYDPARRHQTRFIMFLISYSMFINGVSNLAKAWDKFGLSKKDVEEALEEEPDELEIQGLSPEDFKKFKSYKSILDFMSDTKNVGSNIYIYLKKIFYVFVLSPLGAKLNLSGKGFQDLLDRFLGSVSDKDGFIESILSLAKMSYELLHKCIAAKSLSPLFEEDSMYIWYENVKQYMDETIAVGIKNGVSDSSIGADYLERGKLLHREGISKIRSLDPKNDPGEYNTANYVLRKLFDHLESVSLEFGVGRMRQQAFAMGIISTPGIGKTSFRNDVEIIVGAVNNIRFAERLTASATAGDKYNAAFKQWSKFYRIDDIDKAIDANDISPWMNVVRLLDNCALPLNTADVSTKGKLVPTPVCLTITSNSENFGISGLTDYAFFFRRIDHVVKLYPADDLPDMCFVDPSAPLEEKRFDWRKVNSLEINQDLLYKINVHLLNQNLPACQTVDRSAPFMDPVPAFTFSDIKDYHRFVKERAVAWKQDQEVYIGKMNSKVLCNYCNLLQHMCECPRVDFPSDDLTDWGSEPDLEPEMATYDIFTLESISWFAYLVLIYTITVKSYTLLRYLKQLYNFAVSNPRYLTALFVRHIVDSVKADRYLAQALEDTIDTNLDIIVEHAKARFLNKWRLDDKKVKNYASYFAMFSLSLLAGYHMYKKYNSGGLSAEAFIGVKQEVPVGRTHVFTQKNTVLPDTDLNTTIFKKVLLDDFKLEITTNLYTVVIESPSGGKIMTMEAVHLGNDLFLMPAHGFLRKPTSVETDKDFNPSDFEYVDEARVVIMAHKKDSVLQTEIASVVEKNVSFVTHETADYMVLYVPGAAVKTGLYKYLSSSLPASGAVYERATFDLSTRERGYETVTSLEIHSAKYRRYDESNPLYKYKSASLMDKGHCGLPTFSYRNGNLELFGIHVAGSTKVDRPNDKYLVRVEKFEIDSLLDKLYKANKNISKVDTEYYYAVDGGQSKVEVTAEAYIHPNCPVLNVQTPTELTPIGILTRVKSEEGVTKKFQSSTNFRSKTIMNPAGPLVAPELLVLNKDDPIVIPKVTNKVDEQGRYVHPDLTWARNVHDEANVSESYFTNLLLEHFKDAPKLEGIQYLKAQTIDEAITGWSDNLVSNRMKLNSSTGFPRGGKKSKYIEIDNKTVLRNDILEDIKSLHEAALQGKKIVICGIRALKDEGVKKSKLEERGVRPFVCVPASYNIYCKQYLDPFMTLFVQHRDYFHTLLGVNLPSREVYEYMRMKKAFDPNFFHFDGDIRHMDLSVLKSAKLAINNFIRFLAKFTAYSEEDMIHLEAILQSWISIFIACNGDLFLVSCYLPSGGWYTAFFGTLFCILLFLYVHDRHKLKYLLEYNIRAVSPSMFCGDDNNIGAHHTIKDTFNFDFYRDQLKSIGVIYTPPNKTSLTQISGSFWNTEILKRKVKWNAYIDEYVAVLDPKSLAKMMTVITRTDVGIEIQLAGIFTSLLMEAFLHDLETYKLLRYRVFNFCDNYKSPKGERIKLPQIILSEKSLLDRYKKQEFSVWDAFEEQRIYLENLELQIKSNIITGSDGTSTQPGLQHRDFAYGSIVNDKGRLLVVYNKTVTTENLAVQAGVKGSSVRPIVTRSYKMIRFTASENNNNNLEEQTLETNDEINMVEELPTQTVLNDFVDLGPTVKEVDVVTRPMQLRDPMQRDDDLKDYLTSRYFPIGDTTWSSAQGLGTTVATFNVLELLLRKPMVLNKIKYYKRLAGKFRVRIVYKSPPAFYGALQAFCEPIPSPAPPTVTGLQTFNRNIDVYNSFQMRHVTLSASSAQTAEITLPWISRYSYQDITNIATLTGFEQWKLHLVVLAPLLSSVNVSQTVNIQFKILAAFDEINLSIPEPEVIPEMDISGTVDSLQKSKIISKTAKQISSVANKMSSLPVVGDAAKIVAGVSTSVGTIAAKLGFSKPAMSYDYTRFVPFATTNLATVDNVDRTVPLSLLTLNSVDCGNTRYNENNIDVLSHDSFFSKLTLIHNQVVNTTATAGSEVFRIFVNPKRCFIGGGSIHTSPVGLVSSFYTHWSGPLTYQLRTYMSSLHVFRYRIEYIPSYIGVIPANTDFTSETYSILVDASQNNSVEFTIGWANDKYVLKCGSFEIPTNWHRSEEVNGYFRVVIVDPVTSNNTSATNNNFIYMHCLIKADNNLKLYNYGESAGLQGDQDILAIQSAESNSATKNLVTQIAGAVSGSAAKVTKVIVNDYDHDVSNIVTGEVLDSVRGLLKKPQYLTDFVYDTADVGGEDPTEHNNLFYAFRALFLGPLPRKDLGGIRLNTWMNNNTVAIPYTPLSMIPYCFLGWSGHLKYKWMSNDLKDVPFHPSDDISVRLIRPIIAYMSKMQKVVFSARDTFTSSLAYFDATSTTGGRNGLLSIFKLHDTIQPVVNGFQEVSFPYYRPYRFEFTNVYPNVNDLDPDPTSPGEWYVGAIGGVFKVLGQAGVPHNRDYNLGSIYYSAGEDFSLGIFVCTPVLISAYTP